MDKLFDPQMPLLSILSAGFEVEQIGPAGSHRRVSFCRIDVYVARKGGQNSLGHVKLSLDSLRCGRNGVQSCLQVFRAQLEFSCGQKIRQSVPSCYSVSSAIQHSPSTLAQPSRTASIFSLET